MDHITDAEKGFDKIFLIKKKNKKPLNTLGIEGSYLNITSWETGGETVETVSDYFLGLQNHCRW